MGKKLTLKEAHQEFIDRDLIPLFNTYINSKEKLLSQTHEGYLIYVRLSDLKSSGTPNIVDKSNPFSIHNIKLWCKLNNKPFKLISDEYKGNKELLKWECLKEDCGEIFEARWNSIQSNQGCGFCRGYQVGLSNCLATKNTELAKEWNYNKNGDLTPYNVTLNSRIKPWWVCIKCGYEWESTMNNRNNGNGCPHCNESKGEKEISNVLNSKNIFHIPQKTFDKLVGLKGGLLSYDFYLSQYNLLVEYQGEMHERFIKGIHKSKKDFEKQVEHDRRKRKYAKDHNIRLLEIWYWDFDKIEKILEKELNLVVL